MAKESTTNPRSQGSTGTSSRRASDSASSQVSGTGAQQVNSSVDTSERKSFGAIISQGLAEEGQQEGIDRIFGELREYFDKGRTYIQENPREAAGLAIACGVGAWALLGTKPGRVLFEAGAAIAIPYVTRWVSTNMKAVSH